MTEQTDTPPDRGKESALLRPGTFARFWACSLALLMLATAPLWGLSWSSAEDLPAIGWLPEIGLPSWIDRGLVAVVLVGLLLAATNVKRRVAWLVVGLCLALLILLDQHRLQPWAYQSLAYAAIFSLMPWAEGRRWVIAITVSIYAYSAIGKFDFQFAHTVGHDLVNVFAAPLGGLNDESATRAALMLPIGELTTAVLIAVPRTRRLGGILAIGMHVTLIGLLGPWLLNHSWGVLCWNAVLALQSGLLFVHPSGGREAVASMADQRGGVADRIACWPLRLALTILLLAPLTERSGYWDHWTSWALYSPHNSRADIQIHESAFDRLPESLRPYLHPAEMSDRWYDLDVETWSFQRRWAPVYPQGRYQLAIAQQLAHRFKLGPAIRVRLKGVADRWTGQRASKVLVGSDQIFGADSVTDAKSPTSW